MIIVFDNIKRQFYSKENPTCIRIFQRLWEGEKKYGWEKEKPMKNELKKKKKSALWQILSNYSKNECLKWQEEKKCCELIKPPNKWQ